MNFDFWQEFYIRYELKNNYSESLQIKFITKLRRGELGTFG
jgi:hypothetical protein